MLVGSNTSSYCSAKAGLQHDFVSYMLVQGAMQQCDGSHAGLVCVQGSESQSQQVSRVWQKGTHRRTPLQVLMVQPLARFRQVGGTEA